MQALSGSSTISVRRAGNKTDDTVYLLKRGEKDKKFKFPGAGLLLVVPALQKTLDKIVEDKNGSVTYPGITEPTHWSDFSKPEFWFHESVTRVFSFLIRPYIANYKNADGSLNLVLSFRILQEVAPEFRKSYNGREWLGPSVNLSLQNTRDLLKFFMGLSSQSPAG